MNVLLCYICYPPESNDLYGSRLPIGLGYLATALMKAGHRATIKNLSSGGLKELKEILTSQNGGQKFDLAGFSLFTFNRRAVIDATRLIKEISPKTVTVVGGPHPTALPKDYPFKYPSIDLSVSGPGEKPLIKILEELQHKVTDDWESNSNNVTTSGSFTNNLDHLDNVDHLDNFDSLDHLGSPSEGMNYGGVKNADDYTFINSSRGCRGNCTFCSSPSFWKRKMSFHSVDWIINELNFRVKKISCNFISFRDESFTADSNRIRSLCKAIIKDKSLNFTFDCQCRADQIDEETTNLMAEAGCKTIQLGIEHGSENLRKLLGKPCDDETIIKATQTIRKAGIEPSWYLISAIPDETKADRLKTRQLVKNAQPTDVLIAPLSLYPGTALFTKIARQKKWKDDFWFTNQSDWVLAMPEEEAKAIVEKETKAINGMTKNFALTK